MKYTRFAGNGLELFVATTKAANAALKGTLGGSHYTSYRYCVLRRDGTVTPLAWCQTKAIAIDYAQKFIQQHK